MSGARMIQFSQSYLLAIIVFFTTVEKSFSLNKTDFCPNERSSMGHIRKRRHIAFPDGSTVSLTTSAVKTFMTHVPSGWFSVVEADVGYPLPDSKFVTAHSRRKLHHRQKREFWEAVESALLLRNMNGRSCVLRSICEAKTHLSPPGRSLVHDILRVVFTNTVQNAFTQYVETKSPEFYRKGLNFTSVRGQKRAPLHDDEFKEQIGPTFNELLEPNLCDRHIDCPFSLVDFFLEFNRSPGY